MPSPRRSARRAQASANRTGVVIVAAHALAHKVRRYRGTQARDIGREVSLEHDLAVSAFMGGAFGSAIKA
jgi:hypothetical protein